MVYQAEAIPDPGAGTGEMLADMTNWNYGLPFAQALGDDSVLVVHYAGTAAAMDIRWVRLRA